MFQTPTRKGFSVTPKVNFNKNKEKMSAPNNATYHVNESTPGLPNSVIFPIDLTGETDKDFLQFQTDTWKVFDLFSAANTWTAKQTIKFDGILQELNCTTDSASHEFLRIRVNDRATATGDDEGYESFFMDDADGNSVEVGRLFVFMNDTTVGGVDAGFGFSAVRNSVLQNMMILGSTGIAFNDDQADVDVLFRSDLIGRLLVLDAAKSSIGIGGLGQTDAMLTLFNSVGSDIAFKIVGRVNQSASLQEWETSTGATGALIDEVGDLVLNTYTDSTRPTAGTAGRIVFNTDDGQLNVDDGTNWLAPASAWTST